MKSIVILLALSLSVGLFSISCSSSESVEKLPEPKVIPVEEWGGNPPTGTMPEHEITHVTIHHSGVEYPEDRNPEEYMRSLQRFSVEDKNWIDIPYHFCIDPDGKIFQARPLKFPGDTNTEYDPTGHALINVIGNFEIQEVTQEQLDATIYLTAWLAQQYEVPTDSIATHKDYSDNTSCPGEDLYQYFEDGSFVGQVGALLK